MVRTIRTGDLIGQIRLTPDNSVLASQIDAPSLFSKKACIKKWSLAAEGLTKQFCDRGRNVRFALGASPASDYIVGFAASQIHKDLEGHVYAVSGRVDVWDMRSGNLIAYSGEVPRLLSYIQISPDGHWLLADRTLLQIGTNTQVE
jgi:hypothetical protein